jgi:hypothetical protein
MANLMKNKMQRPILIKYKKYTIYQIDIITICISLKNIQLTLKDVFIITFLLIADNKSYRVELINHFIAYSSDVNNFYLFISFQIPSQF